MTERDHGDRSSRMSLEKVALTKAAPRISLDKPRTGGSLMVNLNWSARPGGRPEERGLLSRLRSALQPAIDLDLGCLWQFDDGSKGVVQALGNAFEARNAAGEVVLSLDGDDRSGAVVGGENLRINLDRVDSIRRLLVFAMIYQGPPNWAEARAAVTLTTPEQAPIEVLLDEADPQARLCAIALIHHDGAGLSIQREVRYVHGGQDVLDLHYQWGLDWTPGRK